MTETDSLTETECDKEEQAINLINRVSEQFLSQGRHVSPVLYAIQELSGTKPSEKYRVINQVVKVKSKKDAQSNGSTLDVPAHIQDFISTKVSIEMKSIDVIIRCLKSEDKTVVNQALKAKWFFHHTNPHLSADLFASSIIPHVSEYTRFKIIKALSHCLVTVPNKAENFFTVFVELYGAKIALPLLTACSEDFIYDEVMRRKLILPHHMLLTIYKRCPNVVVRYLNLGCYANKKNEEARKIHSINLEDYIKFIPHLIRHDIEFFIELIECYQIHNWWGTTDKLMKIGSTLTSLFFKKATNVLIEKPSSLLDLWPIKVVRKKLTVKQYGIMYSNLFPKTITNFQHSLSRMIRYLEGYPAEKRYYLLTSQFKLKYQKDLEESFEHIDRHDLDKIYDIVSVKLYEKLYITFFPVKERFKVDYILDILWKYPEEKKLNLLMQTYQLKYGENLLDDIEQVKSEKLFKLLPSDLKINLAKRIVEPYEVKSTEYYDNCYYLPLSESFPIYKEAIQKSSVANNRYVYIEKMLKSCSLYNNMDDLLQVIKYYSIRHANEQVDIFTNFLRDIETNFDLKSFGEMHWIAILELFKKLSIKGELSKVSSYYIKPFFNAIVYYEMVYCKETKHSSDHVNRQSILPMFLTLVIDYNIDVDDQIWTFSEEYPLAQKACFDALLQRFPAKYPTDHYTWKQKGSRKKVNTVKSVLEAMNNCNNNVKKQSKQQNYPKYDIREYPWLLSMTKEILDSRDQSPSLTNLKRALKKHSPELYNSLTGSSNFAVDIKSGSAWIQLKKNYSDVMLHWREYLSECREKLRYNSKRGGPAARRFLLSTKWYDSLPICFVEQCLKELNEPGSLKVLAILLDSEVFTSLATTFAPKESITTYENAKDYFALVKSIPPAINFVNPPVPFDVIIMYCQGNYSQLAVQAFEHITHLVPKEKIMAFADNLINKPISVKKHGIRLLFKVASTEELRLFLIDLLAKEKHTSVRELICNIIQERFINSPNPENLELVKICISALTVQDEAPLDLLCNVKLIKNKFTVKYITELVTKIDELSSDPEFPEAIKKKCICTLLSNISGQGIKHLPEQIILQLLEKYYFNTDSLEISAAAQGFAKRLFSQRYTLKSEDV